MRSWLKLEVLQGDWHGTLKACALLTYLESCPVLSGKVLRHWIHSSSHQDLLFQSVVSSEIIWKLHIAFYNYFQDSSFCQVWVPLEQITEAFSCEFKLKGYLLRGHRKPNISLRLGLDFGYWKAALFSEYWFLLSAELKWAIMLSGIVDHSSNAWCLHWGGNVSDLEIGDITLHLKELRILLIKQNT